MTPSDPPSFRPSQRRPRPPAQGARRVTGREVPGESSAAPPRRRSIQGGDARDAVRRNAGGAGAAGGSQADQWGAGEDPWEVPPSYEPNSARAYSPGSARPAGAATQANQMAQYREASRLGQAAPPPHRDARPRRRRRSPLRSFFVFLLALLVLWPVGLLAWANTRINHTGDLPSKLSTPGTTYLLAGSDSRADGSVADGTTGQRADSILLLHKPTSGSTVLISLPRDTYVDIPGHGGNKLNASYSLGGPELLAASVEELTGLGVDHYVEVGMGGVMQLVDAVGGVELCMDYDVKDSWSGLDWTAGCHQTDGTVALQFARMRHGDPQGDIGRAARQRQVIGAVADSALSPVTLVNPARQVKLVGAGTDALTTDPGTGIIDLGRMALAFRSATGANGLVGTPPIASVNYSPGGIGAAVLLDRDEAPVFFDKLMRGELTAEDVK